MYSWSIWAASVVTEHEENWLVTSVKNHQNTSWLKNIEQNWLVETDVIVRFCLACAGRSTPWCSMSLCCCSWAGGMWRGLVCLDPAVTAAPTARPPSPLMTGTNTRITVIMWSLQHDNSVKMIIIIMNSLLQCGLSVQELEEIKQRYWCECWTNTSAAVQVHKEFQFCTHYIGVSGVFFLSHARFVLVFQVAL